MPRLDQITAERNRGLHRYGTITYAAGVSQPASSPLAASTSEGDDVLATAINSACSLLSQKKYADAEQLLLTALQKVGLPAEPSDLAVQLSEAAINAYHRLALAVDGGGGRQDEAEILNEVCILQGEEVRLSPMQAIRCMGQARLLP